MTILFTGINCLSVIQIEEQVVIVDNDLEVYDRVSLDDPFLRPKEILRKYVKATKKHFKNFMFKQFEALAYKQFATSEFCKQVIEEEKKNA